MKSFIFSTFLFLFGGFYAMSGGPNFVPNEVSPFAEGREVPEIPTYAAAATNSEQVPVVSKSQIILASAPLTIPVSNAVQKKTFGEPNAVLATLGAENAKSIALTAPKQDAATAKVELASLTSQGDAPAAKAAEDLRKVVASRVNMRNGPGTQFDVISTLVRDEEVEVLRSNENGWVRLRTASGRVGWMAERLLSKNAN